MHPRKRHVPPRRSSFSTMETESPSCAARIAPTYPPGPLPITTRSFFNRHLAVERSKIRFAASIEGNCRDGSALEENTSAKAVEFRGKSTEGGEQRKGKRNSELPRSNE